MIKDISTRVMEAIHSHQSEEHVKKVVQTSARIKLLQSDFDKLKSTTLSEYNLDNFAVGRDQQYNPAVPEFLYNRNECSQFIKVIG